MNIDYKGWDKLVLSDDEINELYSQHTLNKRKLYENEYVGIEDENGKIDKFCFQKGKLRPVKFPVISSQFSGSTKPRNLEQEYAMDMLKDPTTAIKLVTGTFGTGKTLMLIVAALEAIEKGRFEKIIWVRNNIQVKDTDQLGALPGSEFEKLLPYVGPMMDHVGGLDGIMKLIESEQLEVQALGYIRGRSIRNSVIIASEAENLTKQHIQLLIGRVDEGSNLWMDADLRQRDKETFTKSAGIETTIDRLKGEKLFGYVHLEKCERSEAARLADKLD